MTWYDSDLTHLQGRCKSWPAQGLEEKLGGFDTDGIAVALEAHHARLARRVRVGWDDRGRIPAGRDTDTSATPCGFPGLARRRGGIERAASRAATSHAAGNDINQRENAGFKTPRLAVEAEVRDRRTPEVASLDWLPSIGCDDAPGLPATSSLAEGVSHDASWLWSRRR